MGTKKSILAKIWPTKLLQGMVFAEEFESPEALTDYLHILSKNKTRYENMLKWRTDGYDITTWTKGLRFEGGKEDTSCWWCDLCSLKQTANIRDADMWPVGTDFTCKKRQKEWWLSGKNPTPNGEKATPTATATKHFVYLIQSAKPHKDPSNRLVPTGERDILYLFNSVTSLSAYLNVISAQRRLRHCSVIVPKRKNSWDGNYWEIRNVI